MESLVPEILAVFDRVRSKLLTFDFKPPQVTIKKERIEKATEKEQKEALQFLVGFEAKFIKEYEEAKSLVPELVWTLYRASGGKPRTHEEFEMIHATEQLTAAWRGRPFILTRNPNVAQTSGKQNKQPAKSNKRTKQKTGSGTPAT